MAEPRAQWGVGGAALFRRPFCPSAALILSAARSNSYLAHDLAQIDNLSVEKGGGGRGYLCA